MFPFIIGARGEEYRNGVAHDDQGTQLKKNLKEKQKQKED